MGGREKRGEKLKEGRRGKGRRDYPHHQFLDPPLHRPLTDRRNEYFTPLNYYYSTFRTLLSDAPTLASEGIFLA